jgi:1-acyl-sn-glycerol-3-phosphate acyltransferase
MMTIRSLADDTMTTHIRAVLSFAVLTVNTLVHFVPILLLGLLKWLLPEARRKTVRRMLMGLANGWVRVNRWALRHVSGIRLDVEGELPMAPRRSFLVIANHRSWADILILQTLLSGRVPFLTFFLKQQLIWVPVLGLAWWALDFPFMRRYSREYLKKHPEKAGKDLQTTRRACEKFRHIPVAIMVFPEGTRFTAEKHKRQQSPYGQLLKPKAGGIGYVLTLLGDQIDGLLDISIAYPSSSPRFWDFLGGALTPVRVRVDLQPLDASLACNYVEDPQCRVRIQRMINTRWALKDKWLSEALPDCTSRPTPHQEHPR